VPADLLTTHAAAALAGVGPTAIKRWADSGLLGCVRTPGGHRRFPRHEVEALIRRRDAGAPDAATPAAAWCDLLLAAGDDGRDVEARLLDARGRAGAWAAVGDELGAALTELGERWARKAITVIEEHLASERLARALARCAAAIPVAPSAPIALLVGADGDDHTLGLSLVEVCLREAGWRTRWAGRATPTPDVVATIDHGGVALVALSASIYSRDRRRLARQLGTITTAASRRRCQVVVGGGGAWPAEPKGARRFTDLASFAPSLRGAR
jgi:excisionase family DNA binding protein